MNPHHVRTLRALALVVLLPPLTGCYYYASVDRPSSSDPTQIVRARLPEATDMEMSTDVTVRSVVQIEGRPVDWRGDTLLIRATSLHQTGNRAFTPPRGETFSVPRSRLADLQERRLDAGRTALLAGGVAAGATGLAVLLFGGEAGGSEGEPLDPEPPPESRIVGFMLPLSLLGGR